MKASNVVFGRWLLIPLGLGLLGIAPSVVEQSLAVDDPSSNNVSKEQEILFKFVGRWKIEEKYHPDGEKGKGSARFEKQLDDNVLVGEYKSTSKDMGTNVKGHAIFAYDPDEAKYRYWWFDNYGALKEFLGEYSPRKNALILTHKFSDLETKEALIDQYTFKFENENKIVFTWERGADKENLDLLLTTTYTNTAKKSTQQIPARAKSKPRTSFR